MDPTQEFRQLRGRIDELERRIHQIVDDRDSRDGIFLGQVIADTDSPDPTKGVFMGVHPVKIRGPQREGQPATLQVYPQVISVMLIGPAAVKAGDYRICRQSGNVWVARKGLHNKIRCGTCMIPKVTLTLTVSLTDGESGSTLLYWNETGPFGTDYWQSDSHIPGSPAVGILTTGGALLDIRLQGRFTLSCGGINPNLTWEFDPSLPDSAVCDRDHNGSFIGGGDGGFPMTFISCEPAPLIIEWQGCGGGFGGGFRGAGGFVANPLDMFTWTVTETP